MSDVDQLLGAGDENPKPGNDGTTISKAWLELLSMSWSRR